MFIRERFLKHVLIQDENPQVDHSRAVKEYDRSAADKVSSVCDLTVVTMLNNPHRKSSEQIHIVNPNILVCK